MRDDEIGPNVRPRGQGLIGGVRMPGGVLEAAAGVVRLLGGAAADAILDALDAADGAGRLFGQEGAAKPLVPRQIAGDVAELGWEILMNEQDVHDAPAAPQACRPA